MHQKSNQNLFTNCKSFLHECQGKKAVKLSKNDTSDETDEENDKDCFFENELDEEKSDSEENQEYLNKNDESDIEFDSDVDTEEGFPVKNAYEGEEYEMEEEKEGEDDAQDEKKKTKRE